MSQGVWYHITSEVTEKPRMQKTEQVHKLGDRNTADKSKKYVEFGKWNKRSFSNIVFPFFPLLIFQLLQKKVIL